ncbi:MAG: BamA/TamA family outer membrane protein [Bacteroidota bacterium]
MHAYQNQPSFPFPIPLRYNWLVILLLLIIVNSNSGVYAQSAAAADKPCIQKDLPGIIREWRGKPPKKNQSKNHSLLIIPSAGVSPTSGFMVGAAAQFVTRDKRPKSMYSFLNGSFYVTTKKQILFSVKNNVYAKNDNIFLSGDWRFLIFSQPTYGLGTNAPEGGALKRHYSINGYDVKDDSLVQPMRFNHVRFYQTISWRIRQQPLFAGVGYHLDYYFGIKDEKLDTVNNLLTSHYLYSRSFGFSNKKYATSGVSLNLTGDTRDNLVNPRKGYFYNINWRLYPTFLGSSKNSTMLNLEWRSFYNVSKTDKRKILGAWLMGNFTPVGKLPYLSLPALGYDQRGRSGRGYAQGRFRGANMIYGEGEYRFPLSACGGIFGGVIFANFTTTDTPNNTLNVFGNIAPGAGVGLRVMVDKLSKSNLQVDFGVGRKSFGVYIGVGETF